MKHSVEYYYRPFATITDLLLIAFVWYAAFHWEWFIGGFGWFFLLFLSPQARSLR